MANKKVRKFENKVYIRKIFRNMLKNAIKSNKIKSLWKEGGQQ